MIINLADSELLPTDGVELSATLINNFWLLIIVEESSVMDGDLVIWGIWVFLWTDLKTKSIPLHTTKQIPMCENYYRF